MDELLVAPVATDEQLEEQAFLNLVADTLRGYVHVGLLFEARQLLRPSDFTVMVFYTTLTGNVRFSKSAMQYMPEGLVSHVYPPASVSVNRRMRETQKGLAAQWAEEVVTRSEETDIVRCGRLRCPAHGEEYQPIRARPASSFVQDASGQIVDKISLFGPIEKMMTRDRDNPAVEVDTGLRVLYLGRRKQIHDVVRFGDLTICLDSRKF